ncbi:MAG: cell division protein FtsL [Glaciecola sp.]|jgi:cell division protein FtsL
MFQLDSQLLSILLTDLARNFLRVLLFIAVIASAFAVILSVHENRQLSIQLEQLMQQQDELDVEWRHLVLEQSALTEHNRIENIVQQKLGMRRPTTAEEKVVVQ